jgi:methyltransferase (TIGR00027 family)
MKPGRASRTAEHNALFRALEARRPPDVRVVDDQLAEAFLSWRYRALVGRMSGWATRVIDARWPGVRPTVVARTRLIDDTVAVLVGEAAATSQPGGLQVVVLGAGFDTRAWRLACLAEVPVFEVDHPDTQRRKADVIGRLGRARSGVTLVPTDFHLGRLTSAMADAGFDATRPALFLWEGTTNYLDAAAVDATLRWCAAAPAGSSLVFTYVNRDLLTDPGRYVGTERLMSTLRRVDEQMTFGVDPGELPGYLAARGLCLVRDAGAAEFRHRAYGDAAAMRGHEFYRVAHARVARGTKRPVRPA